MSGLRLLIVGVAEKEDVLDLYSQSTPRSVKVVRSPRWRVPEYRRV